MKMVTITWGAGRACMKLNMEEVAECYSTAKFKKLLRCVVGVSDNRGEVLQELREVINRIYADTSQEIQSIKSHGADLMEKRAEAKSKMLQAEYYKTFTVRENAMRDWKEAVKEYNRAKRAMDDAVRKIGRLTKRMDKLAIWARLLMGEGAV